MIALKLLKILRDDYIHGELDKDINEAIREIEEAKLTRREWYQKGYAEAMKNKTCERCRQSWEPNVQTFHRFFCEYLKIPVHGDFCCNRYEPKDNA